jgi:hypothetical protein
VADGWGAAGVWGSGAAGESGDASKANVRSPISISLDPEEEADYPSRPHRRSKRRLLAPGPL